MALLLRVVTKPKWRRPEWMEEGEVPADVLTDLRADNNELSVWVVEPDGSNLDSAIVAVASNRKRLDKLDYALLDEQVLTTLAIDCRRSEGISAHLNANATMHRDLTKLTVRKVADLARAMMPLDRVRIPENKIKIMLREALRAGALAGLYCEQR